MLIWWHRRSGGVICKKYLIPRQQRLFTESKTLVWDSPQRSCSTAGVDRGWMEIWNKWKISKQTISGSGVVNVPNLGLKQPKRSRDCGLFLSNGARNVTNRVLKLILMGALKALHLQNAIMSSQGNARVSTKNITCGQQFNETFKRCKAGSDPLGPTSILAGNNLSFQWAQRPQIQVNYSKALYNLILLKRISRESLTRRAENMI